MLVAKEVISAMIVGHVGLGACPKVGDSCAIVVKSFRMHILMLPISLAVPP